MLNGVRRHLATSKDIPGICYVDVVRNEVGKYWEIFAISGDKSLNEAVNGMVEKGMSFSFAKAELSESGVKLVPCSWQCKGIVIEPVGTINGYQTLCRMSIAAKDRFGNRIAFSVMGLYGPDARKKFWDEWNRIASDSEHGEVHLESWNYDDKVREAMLAATTK